MHVMPEAGEEVLAFPDTQARQLAGVSMRRLRYWEEVVNGQVFVPAGGQLKVPTPRVDQVLFRVVPPLARARRMR